MEQDAGLMGKRLLALLFVLLVVPVITPNRVIVVTTATISAPVEVAVVTTRVNGGAQKTSIRPVQFTPATTGRSNMK